MATIKLDDLDKNSTPCEICVAINGRDVELNKDRNYFNEEFCENITYEGMGGAGGSSCTDADKAMIKLLYLNYWNQT